MSTRVKIFFAARRGRHNLTKPAPPTIVGTVTYTLFIDDRRDPPRDGRHWIVARNVPEAIAVVEERGIPDFIAFDHDLGPHPETGATHDVMTFCRWFENRILDTTPDLSRFGYQVHSDNPPGRDNVISWIEGLLRHARGGY